MPRRTLRRKQTDRLLRRRLTMSAPSSYLAEEKAIAPRGTRGPSNIPSYVFQLRKRHIILVFILSSQNNPCHEMLKHVCTSYVETFPAADVTVVVLHNPSHGGI